MSESARPVVAPANPLSRLAAHSLARELAPFGVIALGTALFFWRLLAGQVWMPAGGGDLAQFLYPTYSFAARWWTGGVIPLWNPYLFAGAPFVGDIQSGVFYPLNVLVFFVASPLTFRTLELVSVLHFMIAGAGMYALLRFGKWDLDSAGSQASAPMHAPAALLGAIAFEFSDLFITHFGNLNLIAVAAWTPLVLLSYRRALTDRRPALAAVSGVLMAIAFFAGHIQSFIFIVLVIVAYALWVGATLRGRPNAATSRSHPLAYLALTALVALGLTAPVLIPAVEMAQHTVRSTFTYEQAAQFSLPPAELIGLFVPGFFGRGPQNVWGPWDRVEVGYIGVLPLLLALLAVVLRRDAPTRFFGLLALLGLALALGGYGILHGWLYQFVPGLNQLRAPARFVFVFDLAIAMLAALGMDSLLRTLPDATAGLFKRLVRVSSWAYLLVALAAGSSAYTILILGQNQDPVLFARMANAVNALAFFLVLLALALALLLARATGFLTRSTWSVLALALVFFDLFSLGAYVDLSADDPTRVFEHPDAVAFLKSDPAVFRVDPRGTGVDTTWPADTSILYGLFDVNGDNPLVLGDFNRYWESYGTRSSALYDLLNAKYLIGRKSVPLDRDKFKLAYDGDPALNIYENTRALPRAFVVHTSRVIPDAQSALAAIRAPDFDPAQVVVLDRGTSLPSVSTRAPEPARITGYGPNEIRLDVNAPAQGILFLSEVYYPGWRAWVDDREVDVLRADFLFRAVELPAGTHQVRFLYDPLSFKLGVVFFGLTVLGLAGWGAWKNKTRTRDLGTSPMQAGPAR